MNSRQRAHRDLAMVVESLAGRTYAQIGQHYGVSEKTVQRAIRRVKQTPAPMAGSADLLDALWQRNSAALEELVFARLQARNPRTRVAAIRVQAELLASQFEMLRILGVVAPPSASASIITVERVQKILLAKAKREGLGADAQSWLLRATEDLLDETAASSGESGQFSA